jgi:hypothetical protein
VAGLREANGWLIRVQRGHWKTKNFICGLRYIGATPFMLDCAMPRVAVVQLAKGRPSLLETLAESSAKSKCDR